MNNIITDTRKTGLLILLIALCSFSISLSLLRVIATGSPMFLFLNWNLFLAIIPWLFTRYLHDRKATIHKWMYIALLATWLLFFPNSPYILTDLFHLKKSTSMPIWYDLVLILSYAWTALVFGFMSLHDIEMMSEKRYGVKKTNIILITLLFMASFGVYLGRFLRWNSWDIIANPFGLASDISDRFINPLDHPRTWGVTVLLGVFLNLAYFSMKYIRKQKN
jgi:uncharacterized membrane protein